MKPGIHPEMVDCTVTCSCGNTFVTLSTNDAMHVDICSNCHPYFTGTQRLVDTAGQVERFNRRLGKKAEQPEPVAVGTEAAAKAAARASARAAVETATEVPVEVPAEVAAEAATEATAEKPTEVPAEATADA